jgi:hypothetical protein
MTHKHAVGTGSMSLNIFLAMATDHKEKKWHDASNANQQNRKSPHQLSSTDGQ